jgi:hypothetical protein
LIRRQDFFDRHVIFFSDCIKGLAGLNSVDNIGPENARAGQEQNEGWKEGESKQK